MKKIILTLAALSIGLSPLSAIANQGASPASPKLIVFAEANSDREVRLSIDARDTLTILSCQGDRCSPIRSLGLKPLTYSDLSEIIKDYKTLV